MQAFITHTRSGPPFTRHIHMHTHQKRHSKHHCGLALASARHQRIPLDKSGPICHSYMDGLVQEKRNSTANALELCLSCTTYAEHGISQITPTNSLPSGEARVIWFSTPNPCGELMGAISLLFRQGKLSAGGLTSPLLLPAFDHTFDDLQLIRATLLFKTQKYL